MRVRDHIEPLARAVYTALADPSVFPDVEYEYQTPNERREQKAGVMKKRRPVESEIRCTHFTQMWGSTALGFGGMGGAAMSEAYTSVIYLGSLAAIFFDGRHAYTVTDSETLREDIKNKKLVEISEKHKYG